MIKRLFLVIIWTLTYSYFSFAQSLPEKGDLVRIHYGKNKSVSGIVEYASMEKLRLLVNSRSIYDRQILFNNQSFDEKVFSWNDIIKIEKSMGPKRKFFQNFFITWLSAASAGGVLGAITYTEDSWGFPFAESRGQAFSHGFIAGGIIGLPVGVIVGANLTHEQWIPLEIPSVKSTITSRIDTILYKTVRIGDQIWMAENLKETHYRNGELIPNVTEQSEWQNLSTGAWCNYDNEIKNDSTYGKLYNWYAIIDDREIAPHGWHIPTRSEWQKLFDYLKDAQAAGSMIQENGILHWQSSNSESNNLGSFTVLPGGCRSGSGSFVALGQSAYFWSATNYDNEFAWFQLLDANRQEISQQVVLKNSGLSVRCIKDYE